MASTVTFKVVSDSSNSANVLVITTSFLFFTFCGRLMNRLVVVWAINNLLVTWNSHAIVNVDNWCGNGTVGYSIHSAHLKRNTKPVVLSLVCFESST